MLKVSKSSWHYKLYEVTYGDQKLSRGGVSEGGYVLAVMYAIYAATLTAALGRPKNDDYFDRSALLAVFGAASVVIFGAFLGSDWPNLFVSILGFGLIVYMPAVFFALLRRLIRYIGNLQHEAKTVQVVD